VGQPQFRCEKGNINWKLYFFVSKIVNDLIFWYGGESNGILIIAGGLDRGDVGFVGDAGLAVLDRRIF